MNYTDNQLKAALAKMLPNRFEIHENILSWICTNITGTKKHYVEVLDTELLHLCWLVSLESKFSSKNNLEYWNKIEIDPHASWQQRVVALAKVKGIEI